MSLRRFISLMHGLGYTTAPIHEHTRPRTTVASQEDLRQLVRGRMRYAPGGES